MSETTMQASTFKARCLSVLDDVAANHATVVITKHGRPIARLVPIDAPRPTHGTVVLLSKSDADYFSTGEGWDAES